jgi:flagellar basal-body rod modification protein FlgD
MDINNILSQTSQAFNQKDKASNSEMGQQEFLQLLVAQMRNQDPINPLDSKEFAAQLAQFNSVEQLISVNSGLSTLQGSQEMMSASLTNSMAASMTGKHVKALSSEVYLAPGGQSNIQYKLNNSASEVEIVIRNESGSEVRREKLSGVAGGENQWSWDGRNDAGDRMADGNYYVEIQASNEGSKVDALTYVEGTVGKVRYTGSGVFLHVNGVNVSIGDVEEVAQNSNEY